jgi:hypothetical protein
MDLPTELFIMILEHAFEPKSGCPLTWRTGPSHLAKLLQPFLQAKDKVDNVVKETFYKTRTFFLESSYIEASMPPPAAWPHIRRLTLNIRISLGKSCCNWERVHKVDNRARPTTCSICGFYPPVGWPGTQLHTSEDEEHLPQHAWYGVLVRRNSALHLHPRFPVLRKLTLMLDFEGSALRQAKKTSAPYVNNWEARIVGDWELTIRGGNRASETEVHVEVINAYEYKTQIDKVVKTLVDRAKLNWRES